MQAKIKAEQVYTILVKNLFIYISPNLTTWLYKFSDLNPNYYIVLILSKDSTIKFLNCILVYIQLHLIIWKINTTCLKINKIREKLLKCSF